MSAVSKGIAAFFRAVVISAAIVFCGQDLWQPLVLANMKFHPEFPWSPLVMAGILAALILYLSGFGWPRSTSAARREYLRWNRVPVRTFFLAILAGVLALAAFTGLWIAVSDLTHIPAGVQPKMTGVPLPTAIAILIASSIAAPVSEEAAFRGYAQGILEKAWGSPIAAIVGATVLFAAAHVLQGLDPVKLSLYFGAGLIFAAVAYLTNSLFPAMIVHGIGDILGFTIFWPHDQQAHGMGFSDPWFAPALAAIVLFAPLAAIVFAKLVRISRPIRESRRARMFVADRCAA